MKKRLVCIGLALALLAGLSLTAAAEDLELPAPEGTGQIDTLQLITVVPFAECIEIVAIAYAITGFVVGVFGSMLSIRKFLRV